jgi:hypothetical protein
MDENQTLILVATAKLSNRSPADELGIADEAIAQALNMECAIAWDKFQQERENDRLATQLLALATGGISGTAPKPETKKFSEQSF